MKLKLIPLAKSDRSQLYSLLNEYTSMIKEAPDIIVRSDARSKKKAHELCYACLRERHPHLHNKFVQEAYKRALAMYRSYRKLLNRWKKLPEEKRKKVSPPSLPRVEENRVIELHVDTYRVERKHGFLTLTISRGGGVYLKFLVVECEHARRGIEGAKLGSSRLLVDYNCVFLLLTVRRDVGVVERRSKLVIDVNEDSVASPSTLNRSPAQTSSPAPMTARQPSWAGDYI